MSISAVECGPAQPLTHSHCCAPLPCSLLLGNHYRCSAIGWCHKGPTPQATNCQWVTVSGPAQPLVSAIVGLYPRWPWSWTVIGQHHSRPSQLTNCQWVTAPISGPCPAIGWCHSGPPTATNCQWVTVSGPAQPLVSAIAGLYPKWPLVVLVSHWSVPQWGPSPNNKLSVSDN